MVCDRSRQARLLASPNVDASAQSGPCILANPRVPSKATRSQLLFPRTVNVPPGSQFGIVGFRRAVAACKPRFGYSGFARFKPLLGFLALIRHQLGFAAKTNADSQSALGAYDPLCTRPDERTLKLGQGAKNRQHQLAVLRRAVGQCISANDLKLAPAWRASSMLSYPLEIAFLGGIANERLRSALVGAAVGFCRQHQNSTIFIEAANAYRGMRALQAPAGT